MKRFLVMAILASVATFAAGAAWAQDDGGTISIMKPEPWLPPKYQSPRSEKPSHAPKVRREPAPRAAVPPTLYVPQTGRTLPNLPALSPSGPNGIETGQDRAMRCAHQLGTAGADAGNPSAYLGSCVNQ